MFEAEEVLPISKIALEAYGVGIASQPPIGGTSIDAVTTIHATILDKLTNAIATQIGEFKSFVRDRHEELEKQSRDNEDRWKGRISALDKEYADKVATLDERNLALDRREAELDNKSNTHARREIRRELNERIRDRIAQFGWSKGTYRNSFPVHAVFLLPIAFAATLAWHWTISVAEQIGAGQGWGPVLAFSFLKQTFAFVGFLIFTSFYIRWLVRNHRELVEGELGLRQFQLDVERASWAAETALEWRREEGTPMPDALIQGVTRDLFKFQHRSSDPDLTAADQLASAILGTASSLNVDTGVAKIQLDKKDLRRLQKTDAKEADK